jgi:4-hydroxy-tetrahydrodipicolinate reductase
VTEALRIVLIGAGGRMGKAVVALAKNEPGLTIAAGAGRGDSLAEAAKAGEVVIDFSLAVATKSVCETCARLGRPLILGSTGQNEVQRNAVQTAAKKIPIVFSANFSVGVNVLFALARTAANSLGDNFQAEIIEAHHRGKVDAPSGTAKQLATEIEPSLGNNREVPTHSIRAGDIIGEHTVIFAAEGERVELTHRATSREIFARGALLAARWVVRQEPGLYEMKDVLGLV